ncbi:hypothetical protein GS891_11760, partial [Rhodococcus hoagii]|nr:hypothetical protein [Prescottella equi]
MTEKWWNEAGPEQIADNWQTARAWQDHSQVAAQAADRIRQEVQSRYGIDVDNPGVDPRKSTNSSATPKPPRTPATTSRTSQTAIVGWHPISWPRRNGSTGPDLLGTDTDDNSTPSDDLRNRQKSSTTQPTAATPSP